MDLQLTSLAADETRRYPIQGLRVNGHAQDLVLVVRWTGASEEYQRAVDALAFRKLDPNSDEWARAIIKLLAQHIVVDWDHVPNGLTYTPARGEQVLGSFVADKRRDRLGRFLGYVASGDVFQRELVDPVDLGNA